MRCLATIPGTWGTGSQCIHEGAHDRHESADGWQWQGSALRRGEESMAQKKNRLSVTFGRRGGKARAASMSAEERSESARHAALAGRKKLNAKERSDAARHAAQARWNGKKK